MWEVATTSLQDDVLLDSEELHERTSHRGSAHLDSVEVVPCASGIELARKASCLVGMPVMGAMEAKKTKERSRWFWPWLRRLSGSVLPVVWAWATFFSVPEKMLRVSCGLFEHLRRRSVWRVRCRVAPDHHGLPGSKLNFMLPRIVVPALNEVVKVYQLVKLKVFVDDITAFMERRNKELPGIGEELQGSDGCGMRWFSPSGAARLARRHEERNCEVRREGGAVWEMAASSLHDDVFVDSEEHVTSERPTALLPTLIR